MFGRVLATPQDETTPFYPRSPYGVAKTYAHYITVNYRESYGMSACAGICFNHESPRRGPEFVTRKITQAAARIWAGKQHKVKLGNLSAKRDWGHAADYVRAMQMMASADCSRDYVIGIGETHTVREFCAYAFAYVGLDWQEYVETDPALIRPAEVDLLLSNPRQAHDVLGWTPRYTFRQLVEEMVEHDLTEAKRD